MRPFPPEGVDAGATNPPDPHLSAPESGQDGSGDLSASLVAELMRAFKSEGANGQYHCPDPRDESSFVVFQDTDGWSSMRALKFGEIADALTATGFRRVVEDDDTIERLVGAIAAVSTPTAGPVDPREYYRRVARAAVRALREGPT